MSKYTPIIGLETHVELKTNSKMFCGCAADYFGKEPNTHTCPVCLGLPGALPVPNKKAIEWCIKIALTLNCKINEFSKFDRKNYFYPDLAKGYQISQYDLPFGYDGKVTLSNGKTIRIRRVHMEEDTGKLMHDGNVSLVDFNRSGVPLVEIVTEPDFNNAEDVKEYLQKLQQTVRYLAVSNADMEKGEMRLEPNISLSLDPKKLPDYKVEVKNINSFRFVEKAIEFEIKRQTELLEKNERPAQETRGFDNVKMKTFSQRSKEDAQEYRYFPEPDIPPIRFTKSQITNLKSELPELPDAKLKRFEREYQLPSTDAEILTRDKSLADDYEKAIIEGTKHNFTPKEIANVLINKKKEEIAAHQFASTLPQGDISSNLPAYLTGYLLATKTINTINDDELSKVIETVIRENTQAVNDYKGGKLTTIMFLVGMVMRKVGKKIDAQMVKEKLEENLK